MCKVDGSIYEFILHWLTCLVGDFPSGSAVRNLLAMQKMWVQSLGQKDPLEKEMATHSSILAWEIPWRNLEDYSPWGH